MGIKLCLSIAFFALMLFLNPAAKALAAEDGLPAYKVGRAIVYPINDMDIAMPLKLFSGGNSKELATKLSTDSMPAGMRAFLVKTEGKTILIDAGIGQAGKSQLMENLKKIGITPEQIDSILLTHMHFDHVGGLIWNDQPAFPKAEILVSAQEKDFWFSDEAMKSNPEKKDNFELARKAINLYGDNARIFVYGDEVAPGLTAMDASGHTPGHTAFMLDSAGSSMLFWGDTMHGAALQFADPRICPDFDMDKEKAVQNRLNMLHLATEKNIPVAGHHLPDPGIVLIKPGQDGDAFNYEDLAAFN